MNWTQEMKDQRRNKMLDSRRDQVIGKTCNKCSRELDDDQFHAQAWGTKCYQCFREMMNVAAARKKEAVRSDPLDYIRNKFHIYRGTSAQRGMNWNISIEELVALWELQEGKCLFTGVELQVRDDKDFGTYLTLDRLDNSIGYQIDNVAFVSREFNQNIKKNIPIEFIKEWIPRIYDIIQNHTSLVKERITIDNM